MAGGDHVEIRKAGPRSDLGSVRVSRGRVKHACGKSLRAPWGGGVGVGWVHDRVICGMRAILRLVC